MTVPNEDKKERRECVEAGPAIEDDSIDIMIAFRLKGVNAMILEKRREKVKGRNRESRPKKKEGNFDRLSTNRSNQLNQSPTEDLQYFKQKRCQPSTNFRKIAIFEDTKFC